MGRLEFFAKKNKKQMSNILILCTGNSCRSQMAHGFLAKMTENKANIYSAGIETHGLNKRAVAIMAKKGIDISQHTSNNVSEYMDTEMDYVITVCDNAKEQCPYFPAKVQVIHHAFSDPAKATGTEAEIMAVFGQVCEEIRVFCEEFVKTGL